MSQFTFRAGDSKNIPYTQGGTAFGGFICNFFLQGKTVSTSINPTSYTATGSAQFPSTFPFLMDLSQVTVNISYTLMSDKVVIFTGNLRDLITIISFPKYGLIKSMTDYIRYMWINQNLNTQVGTGFPTAGNFGAMSIPIVVQFPEAVLIPYGAQLDVSLTLPAATFNQNVLDPQNCYMNYDCIFDQRNIPVSEGIPSFQSYFVSATDSQVQQGLPLAQNTYRCLFVTYADIYVANFMNVQSGNSTYQDFMTQCILASKYAKKTYAGNETYQLSQYYSNASAKQLTKYCYVIHEGLPLVNPSVQIQLNTNQFPVTTNKVVILTAARVNNVNYLNAVRAWQTSVGTSQMGAVMGAFSDMAIPTKGEIREFINQHQ